MRVVLHYALLEMVVDVLCLSNVVVILPLFVEKWANRKAA